MERQELMTALKETARELVAQESENLLEGSAMAEENAGQGLVKLRVPQEHPEPKAPWTWRTP